MTKHYAVHKRRHPEVYDKIKERWEEFEREYWKKHPNEKYCHICGERRNVELHHIVPRHVDPSRIFDESNLIPLCRCCHFRFGHLCNWDLWNPFIVDDAKDLREFLNQRKEDISTMMEGDME